MTPSARPAPVDPVSDAFVRDRFIDMFLGQNRRAQVGQAVAALLIAYIWAAALGPTAPLLWLALVAVVSLVRYRYTDRFVRQAAADGGPRRIGCVLLANGLLMAIPLAAFSGFSELGRAAVSIILLALATASVTTTSGYRSVFLAFAAPMLAPLAVAWAFAPHPDGSREAALGFALLLVFYMLFLVGVGRQSHQIFEESSRFRHGEQQLNRELSKALDEASEANRAKTQFLAAASHDLRQPIHSMNVLVAALSLRELDPRSREIVSLLDSVNQTLSKQLDGLLDISKLDAGTIRAELGVQRLDQLVASHHAATAPVARERGIAYDLKIGGEVSALTDAALLARALSNLTDNAFKFTRRGGAVTVSVHPDGDDAVITVLDTGIGIAKEEQERVFREFYQVGNTERDRSKGLGLGLSIVQRLCQLLDVRLSLVSQTGVGTSITLRLRAVKPTARPEARPVAPAVVPGLSVLVVDDEAMARHSMRLLLSELGCTVHLADSTDQAMTLAREHPIDVMLSDYRLRGEDSGLIAIESVRTLHPDARVVLVTGDTEPGRIREADARRIPLLHKPVSLQDLLGALGPVDA